MPTTLRITTFNVENLFNRYAFLDLPWAQRHYEQFVEATGVVSIASRQGDLVSYARGYQNRCSARGCPLNELHLGLEVDRTVERFKRACHFRIVDPRNEQRRIFAFQRA